jgi:hypothetical protein
MTLSYARIVLSYARIVLSYAGMTLSYAGMTRIGQCHSREDGNLGYEERLWVTAAYHIVI